MTPTSRPMRWCSTCGRVAGWCRCTRCWRPVWTPAGHREILGMDVTSAKDGTG